MLSADTNVRVPLRYTIWLSIVNGAPVFCAQKDKCMHGCVYQKYSARGFFLRKYSSQLCLMLAVLPFDMPPCAVLCIPAHARRCFKYNIDGLL